MIDPVTMNAGKPRDDAHGHAMLNRMNERHGALQKWGLEHISLDTANKLLDIGYGGGQNIKNMCKYLPHAQVYGIDHSEASYKKCAEVNQEAIRAGNVHISVGTVEKLPYGKNTFDLVTAFETVYYWPNPEQCFRSIHEILKDHGSFLICNEDCRLEGNEPYAEALHMTFYQEKELGELLRKAGFRTVHTYLHKNGNWVCAVGRK